MNITKLMPAITLIFLAVVSCQKNSDSAMSLAQSDPALFNTANLVDLNMDEMTSEILDDEGDAVGANGSMSNSIVNSGEISDGTAASCKVVTFSPSSTVFPHTKIIDFGTGCTNGSGITRSGQEIYRVDAYWRTAPNGTRTGIMTFNNFKKNGFTITGAVTSYVNSGAGSVNVERRVVGVLTYRDAAGNTSTFTGELYKKQISGGNTKAVKDDIYQFTGGTSGVEVKVPARNLTDVATWQTTIEKPVVKSAACPWRGEGQVTINIIRLDGTTGWEKLDYGNGTCDNKATLNAKGRAVENITLPLIFYSTKL